MDFIEHEIGVCAESGMQLSEGYIRTGKPQWYGCLPSLFPCIGIRLEDVRTRLEQEVKDYYGYDVIVEIIQSHALAI